MVDDLKAHVAGVVLLKKLVLVSVAMLSACGEMSLSSSGSTVRGRGLQTDVAVASETCSGRRYNVGDHIVCVEGTDLTVIHADGAGTTTNPNIIRSVDEHGTCPSDGFQDIVTSGNSFTILQQNCSGWHFIDERISFAYIEEAAEFRLAAVELHYTDRRDPNAAGVEVSRESEIPQSMTLQSTTLDEVYRLGGRRGG